VVSGSFQPFLETLRGYEVLTLTATPVREDAEAAAPASQG
jgi:superfamily II DNA or RNA helicase